MQYFTKELWRAAQIPGTDDANVRRWREASAAYLEQLERLRPRL